MRVLFHSSMGAAPWGGSEALWSGAATSLVERGVQVTASVHCWPERARQLHALESAGVQIVERRAARGWRRAGQTALRRLGARVRTHLEVDIERTQPDIVVVSNGACLPESETMQRLIRGDVRFLNIGQANGSEQFMADGELPLAREYVRRAEAMCFVSDDNRRLFERQLGMLLPDAVLVRNPYNVARNIDHSGTVPASGEPVSFACVARLHPPSKGQDLLLDVLALAKWRERPVRTSFFGSGPNEGLLRDLIAMLGLRGRVLLEGSTDDIAAVWQRHQVLVLPSRYEGLPLAVVEAMLCGRVVVTTDAGGAKEIIEDNVTGFIARGSTADAVDDAMERAWDRRSQWPAIGAEARRRALEVMPEDPCAELSQRILDLVARRMRPKSGAQLAKRVT